MLVADLVCCATEELSPPEAVDVQFIYKDVIFALIRVSVIIKKYRYLLRKIIIDQSDTNLVLWVQRFVCDIRKFFEKFPELFKN